MSKFVVGLLFVQILLGLYQMSFLADINRGPRPVTSRIPQAAPFAHMATGGLATATWVIWVLSGQRALAWVTFFVLVIGGSLGAFMLSRTVGHARLAQVHADPGHEAGTAPVAERRIPTPSLLLHGLIAAALLVLTLLVALGVFD